MADEFEELDNLDNVFDELDKIDGVNPNKTEQGTVDSVVNDVGSAFKSELGADRLSERIATSVKNTLPNNLGGKIDEATSVVSETLDFIDSSIKPIKSTAAGIAGGIADILPEGMAGPFNRVREWLSEDSLDTGESESEDDRIKKEVEDLFSAFSLDKIKNEAKNNVEELLKKKDTELLANVVAGVNELVLYKSEFDKSYYKRSLELQLKQTYTTVKLYELLKRDSEIRTHQLEAIVKNTALPDFVKTRTSDFAKQMLLNKTADIGTNLFQQSSYMERFKESVKGKVSGLSEGVMSKLGMSQTLIDSFKMAQEAGMSGTEVIASMVIDNQLNKVSDMMARELIIRLMESEEGAGSIKNLDKYLSDPQKGLEELIKKRKNNKKARKEVTKGLEYLKSLIEGNDINKTASIISNTNLEEPTTITNKFTKAVEFVIPSLLSKILLEVSAIRQGKKTISSKDETIYDFNKSEFTTKAKKEKEYKESIDKNIENFITSLISTNIDEKLLKDIKLNQNEKREFYRGLANYLLDGKTTSPYYMLRDGLHTYFKDLPLKKKIGKGIRNLLKVSNEDDLKNIRDVKDVLDNVRRNIGNLSEIASDVSVNYTADIAKDIGLVTSTTDTSLNSDFITNITKKKARSFIDKAIPNKGYKLGGFTGKGDKDEIAGVVHKNEYVLTEKSIKTIIEDVKKGDYENIKKIVSDIVTEVSEKTKDFKIDEKLTNINKNINTWMESNEINKKNLLTIPKTKDELTVFKDELQKTIMSLLGTVKEQFNKIRESLPKNFTELKDVVVTTFTLLKKNFVDIYNSTTKIITDISSTKFTEFTEYLKRNKLVITDKDGKIKQLNLSKAKDGLMSTIEKFLESDTGENKNIVMNAVENVKSTGVKMYSELEKLLGKTPNVTPELIESMKHVDDIVKKEGVGKLLKKGLASIPFPKNYAEAVREYNIVFNTIDPSGSLWEKMKRTPDFIENIQKLHMEVLNNQQEGILGRGIEVLDKGIKKSQTYMGKLRDAILDALPEPLRPIAAKFMDNRLTKYAGRTIDRLKKVGKGALTTTLNEMRIVGEEGKQLFIDKDGRLHMPNLIDLTKFAGKSYFRSMKAVGHGVRELYGGVGGIALDTAKEAGSLGWKFLGVNKAATRLKNKAMAKIKPPIDRKLYNAWTDGKLTANDIMEILPTEEEKEKWKAWLDANRRPGITLPDILLATGKWYKDLMVGASKPTRTGYTALGKATESITKTAFKAAWKFSGISDILPKKKEKEFSALIDLIPDKYIDNFNNDVSMVFEKLGLDSTTLELLYKDTTIFDKGKLKYFTKIIKDIVSEYIRIAFKPNNKRYKRILKNIEELLIGLETENKKLGEEVIKSSKIKTKHTKNKMHKLKTGKINFVSEFTESIDELKETIENMNKSKFNDKDGDGERDNNYKDRLKKLYGKKDLSKKEKKELNKLLKKDRGLDLTSIALVSVGVLSALGLTVDDVKSFIKGSIDIGKKIVHGVNKVIDFMGDVYSYIKHIPEKISNFVKHPFSSSEEYEKEDGDNASALAITAGTIAGYKLGGKHLLKGGIKATKAILNKKATSKVKETAVKSTLSIIKKKLLEKLGKRAATKLLQKIAFRFIPGVGLAYLAYDAAKAGYYMIHDKLNLKSAVSKAVLDFDIFSNDVPIDENNIPIKPSIEYEHAIRVNNLPPNIKHNIKPSNITNRKPVFKRISLNTDLPLTAIVNEIKADESLSLVKYKDSLGYYTIGYGHLLDSRKGGIPLRNIIGVDKDTITKEEAEYILAYDLARIIKTLYRKAPWIRKHPFTIQKNLINMAFNLGVYGLLNKLTTFIGYIKDGRYREAAYVLRKTAWYRQVGNRAERIVNDIMNTSPINTGTVIANVNTYLNNKPTYSSLKYIIEDKVNRDKETIFKNGYVNIDGKTYNIPSDKVKYFTAIANSNKLSKKEKNLLYNKLLDDRNRDNAITASDMESILRKLSKESTPGMELDLSKISNKEELESIYNNISESNKLLEKSVTIQSGIYDKLDELVKLQRENMNNNNKKYSEPDMNPVLQHKTVNF